VSILDEGQAWIARQFARSGANRFEGIPLEGAGVARAPLIAGALARIQCRGHDRYDGGDHTIVIGEVVEVSVGQGRPLVHFARQFGAFVADAESRLGVASPAIPIDADGSRQKKGSRPSRGRRRETSPPERRRMRHENGAPEPLFRGARRLNRRAQRWRRDGAMRHREPRSVYRKRRGGREVVTCRGACTSFARRINGAGTHDQSRERARASAAAPESAVASTATATSSSKGRSKGRSAIRGDLTIAEGGEWSPAKAIEATSVTIAGTLEGDVSASGARCGSLAGARRSRQPPSDRDRHRRRRPLLGEARLRVRSADGARRAFAR
jgi:hypothetical protein